MESNKIVMPVLGALAAAVLGGAVWLAVAVMTEYELGIIAWLIVTANFSDIFSGMDIVFVVLAVVTAWQLPAKLAQNTPPAEQPTAAQ